MNEEEIIDDINFCLEGEYITPEHYDAIQGLLNLYNKEKEKREIAEENHKVLSLDLGKALKELGLYEDTIIADELVLEINKRYISKDKIREFALSESQADTYHFKTVSLDRLLKFLEEE